LDDDSRPLCCVLHLHIDSDQYQEKDLLPAVEALRRGGVVAFPTDTLYALGADPRSSSAVSKLFFSKQRPHDRPIPLVAASLEQVRESVGTLTPLGERLAAGCWPGPLSLIIQASAGLCREIHLGTGKVAVRVPDHPVARALARAAAHALTSTSANVSGRPAPATAAEVAGEVGDAIDVLIDAGPTRGGLPSTIVDVTGSEPVLVRAGAVPWERVLTFRH
jgi:L-threonylcarbamoyladenylate synthase